MKSWTATQIAQHVGGEVIGDGATALRSFAPADQAKPGDLTFAENETYFERAEQSQASAVLVDGAFTSATKTIIRVPKARLAFAKLLSLFFPEPSVQPGVHPSAVVASSAQVDPTVHIGPLCSVGERTQIGPHCVIEAGCQVGPDCELAEAVRLFPNVTIYPRTQIGSRVRVHAGTVIGADGFGYVLDSGAHQKIPQVGKVIIGEDVEIGANVTIDCGAIGATVIGKGTKIDNLVMIGHNVVVGENCILIAQVGIAGSTRLGNFVVLGGQVGVAGHITLGDKVTVMGQSGVMNEVGPGEKLWGSPAQPDRQYKRQFLAMQKLPELLQRMRELERELEDLKAVVAKQAEQ